MYAERVWSRGHESCALRIRDGEEHFDPAFAPASERTTTQGPGRRPSWPQPRSSLDEHHQLYADACTVGSDGQWHIGRDRLVQSLANAGVDPLTQQELDPLALRADVDPISSFGVGVVRGGCSPVRQRLSLAVRGADICPIITTRALRAPCEALEYSERLSAVNGQPPYRWALLDGPSWLSFDPETQELSGQPGRGTSTTATFELLDAAGHRRQRAGLPSAREPPEQPEPREDGAGDPASPLGQRRGDARIEAGEQRGQRRHARGTAWGR